MSKKPAGRYSSCQELADEVRRWQDDEPIFARPAGRIERFSRWIRRHPATATVTSAVLLLLVVVTAVSVVVFSQTNLALVEAKRQRDRAVRAVKYQQKTKQQLDRIYQQAADAAKQRKDAETQLRHAEQKADDIRDQRVEAEAKAAGFQGQISLLEKERDRLRKLEPELKSKLKKEQSELAELEPELSWMQDRLKLHSDGTNGNDSVDERKRLD